MNTSIWTALLVGTIMAADNTTPTWQTDYSQAQQKSAAAKKPLAVVFGPGVDGWTKVVTGASPSDDLRRLLRDKYTCVYVNTGRAAGKKLAEEFGLTDEIGLVLSDRTGTMQAFWHQGDLSDAVMLTYLQKYSTSDVAVTTTEKVSPYRTNYLGATDASNSFRGNSMRSANC